MFYDFERDFIRKLDAWDPVNVTKANIQFFSLGFGDTEPESVRVVTGFEYGTPGGSDRASLGDNYLERTEGTAVVSLFAGKTLSRQIFLELFKELKFYLAGNATINLPDVDVTYRSADLEGGYTENQEGVMSIRMLYLIDRKVVT